MKKFACFVMTYKRPEILEGTINKLFAQTHPPQKVLIVDNDPEKSAENISGHFPDKDVTYFSVGYNSGPAGAAYHGLKILAEEEWDWIGWIDDDDPPVFEDTFQILLNLAHSSPWIGCVGSVGHRFNCRKGLINRIPDSELSRTGILYVDNIAGNMSKIINAEVVKKSKVFPNQNLFFGLEELEFDLRMQKAGYLLACDKENCLRHRVINNRLGIRLRKGIKKDTRGLIREFYSLRNLLFILKWNGAYLGVFSVLFKALLKMISGFRYGINYGFLNFRILLRAIGDFLTCKLGERVKIIEKIK